MDYKEKLREIINSGSEYYPSEDMAVFAKYFPELKESEDDRIVRCLLNYFNHVRYNGLDLKGTDVDEVIAWLEKQGTTDSSIKWYSICQEPEEMRELLCEWDSNDSTWHEVAFYHSDNKTFWNGERQVENVTKWCYIDELFEKQGKKKPIDYNEELTWSKEDERIKTGLIKAVSGILKGNTLYGTDVTREEALTWLEKQGEKKNTRKREIDDAYLQGICDAKHEIKKQGKKLDADKVIAWLVANICDFEYYVKLFKKDFGLC